nr:unnamed protein product [Digitaria exilis]
MDAPRRRPSLPLHLLACITLLLLPPLTGAATVRRYNGTLPQLVYNPNSWTQWFHDHPGYLSNPFYIGGDSYAGKVVPLIAQYVSEGK